jgi:ABC-type multidrug transport system fused ATPase/permease subunit
MKGPLTLLWPFTRGRRVAVAGGLAGTLLVTAAELARPFPLKIVLDQLFAPGGVAEIGLPMIATVAGLVIAIAAVGAAGAYLAEAGMRTAGEHVVHDLRVALYAHLQRLSLRYHRRRHAGDLVTRITGDVNAVGELVTESLVKVVGAVLLLVGMLVVSALLDPLLTLAAAAMVPLLAFATVRSRRTIKGAARRQRAAEGAIAAHSSESLTAIDTVKALGTEHDGTEALRRRSQQRRDAGVEASAAEGRYAGLVDVLEAVGTALVLGVGVWRVQAGALTPGDLVVMTSYVRRLYRPLRELSRQTGRITRALVRAERIAEVLAADDTLSEAPDAHHGPRAAGDIELRDVTFAYDPARPVLDGLSLRIPAGTSVAVIGESGAGKSTIAALLARFHDPDHGAVLLDGHDLRDCSLSWLRQQIGFVLQDTALFSGSVADNIAYGADVDRATVVRAAKVAGAHRFITELPDGYDTDLGPGGAALSGGQRQRLAIARVVVRNPAVVVLDEPTSGLDSASEQAVVTGLERLLAGRTTVLVTHSLRLASRADQVVVIDDGRVVQSGPPAELLAGRGPLRRLAARQGLASPLPVPAPDDPALPRLIAAIDASWAAPHIPAPDDPALPRLGVLLDTDAVAACLERTLEDRGPVLDVTVNYIRYKPATNAVVDYTVTTPDGEHRAVLMVAADRDLAKRAARPTTAALGDLAGGRAPARRPVTFDHELGALVQWLPVDIWLPALAEDPAVVATSLGIDTRGAGPAELLAYKPRRRAVVRVDGHILKLYADDADFRAATTALLYGRTLPVDTATPAGHDVNRRITAQRLLCGTAVDDPLATAPAAGAQLRALHTARAPVGTRVLDPVLGAAATARTVAALLPERAAAIERLLGHIAATAPGPGHALCHGDFHPRQLLRTERGLSVLDFDEWGVGPPALDLGTYAAHALDRSPANGDTLRARVDRIDRVLDALVAGYGSAPDSLRWHAAVAVLRRSVFAFRTRPTPSWPEDVEDMVATAEAVLRR